MLLYLEYAPHFFNDAALQLTWIRIPDYFAGGMGDLQDFSQKWGEEKSTSAGTKLWAPGSCFIAQQRFLARIARNSNKIIRMSISEPNAGCPKSFSVR